MHALPLALLLMQSAPTIETRTVPFPNGARLLSTRISGATSVSVEMWLNSRDLMDRPGSDGWRHMLEHQVLGQAASMEERLERRGYFLQATTYATAMRIRLEVPKSDVELAVAVMRMIAQPLAVDAAALEKERKILGHERALEGSADRALANAVTTLTRGNRTIPMGSDAALAALTPERLLELQRFQFAPTRTLFMMTGDVDHATSERLAGALLSAWRFGNPAGGFTFPDAPNPVPSMDFKGGALGLMLPLVDPMLVAQHTATGQVLAQLISGGEFRRSTGLADVVMTLWFPDAARGRAELANLQVGSVGPRVQALLGAGPSRSLEAISFDLATRAFDPNTPDPMRLRQDPDLVSVEGIEQAIRAWQSAPMIGGNP